MSGNEDLGKCFAHYAGSRVAIRVFSDTVDVDATGTLKILGSALEIAVGDHANFEFKIMAVESFIIEHVDEGIVDINVYMKEDLNATNTAYNNIQ